ncbi:O-antigen ligase family protein [Microbacterium sp. dk485]|uniref:O-antigen ligase family protein n=1 Tax=Microbacterium TaxID=33882 RepID=UPI00107463C0|nr:MULTISPECIES: O-antigen ligase family protein [Microbacterium]TFV83767.1 O-antigen ligase family protein [Microbacterium sp. dk485]TXK18097.1 O-antigen ligase family protein [Microbacterium wangchenii]
MAVHTKHPVSAPPTPPAREKTAHLLLRGWCVFVVLLALGGTAWVHAFGDVAAGALAVVSGLVSIVLWLVVRPPVQGRRMPWLALGYIAWAAASVIWSAWPATTAITWLLLATTTAQGLFVAAVLTWAEIVRTIASALKWVLGLSLLFELWVSIVIQGPILPGWVRPTEKMDPIVYWSRDNLFDWDARIQGIFGNSNLLAGVAVLALVVFAIRLADRAPRRGLLLAWMAAAAFLLVRAGSATAYLSVVAIAVVLGTVLLMRTARRPGERTRWYILYAVVGLGGGSALWFARDAIFGILGRSADLTGREQIWQQVFERASEHPVIGWGFATPWLPEDPRFDGWIIDHGESVLQAHSMWLDAFLQLGIVGVVLLALAYLAFIWRAWFFAIDRPRFDLRADRPYSPLSLLPTLFATLMLVQGVSESGPLLVWGWMLFILLSFKIDQAPLVGVGPAEQSLSIERGDLQSRVP